MQFLQRILSVITAPLRALLSSPGKLFFSPLRRFTGISLPAKIAILLFLVLAIVVPVIIVLVVESGLVVGYEHFTSSSAIASIFILIVSIPIVVYYLLKAWLEGEVSPFHDIEHAWKAGLAELERLGLDLSQIPLFLILGSAGENQEEAIFGAARLNLNVKQFPEGPNPLHWYANPDGVYLVCTKAGCLSQLSHMAQGIAKEEFAGPGPASPRRAPDGIQQTIVPGGEGFGPPEHKSVGPAPAPTSNIRGTMMVGGGGGDTAMPEDLGGGKTVKTVIRLEENDAAEQLRRLEYVCQLIRQQRLPICPINGILTLLPYGLIQRSVPEAMQVQRAVKRDLETLLGGLKLRCPVTALVVGMEAESGFQELVRRVGRERAANNRFGKGFSVSNPPLPDRSSALSDHACGAFEDWVYQLFREKGSLGKPNNTKLFSLLVRVRRRVQRQLENILSAGYGAEENRENRGEAFMFGGCYFAATGDTEDRQAFVAGVFDKPPSQQGKVQWTEAAIEEEQKYQQYATFVLGYDTLALLVLAWLAVSLWLS